MKVTFILRNGAAIDSVIPEGERAGFNFMVMCSAMRTNGYFQSGNMHLQYCDVSGMLLVTEDGMAPAVKPAGSTLQ